MKKLLIGTVLFHLAISIGSAYGQISLSESQDMTNQRYVQSLYVQQHPSLTFNGFKSTNTDNGLSIEQLLNKIYFSNSTEDQLLIHNLFNLIVQDAQLSSIQDPLILGSISRFQTETNSRVLQNLAFVALISYVGDQEGINVQSPPTGIVSLPSPTQAMNDLKTAFNRMLSYSAGIGVLGYPSGDEVHRARSIGNSARAVDLYLAFENAYKYYEGIPNWSFSPSFFLSVSQKNQVNTILKSNIESLLNHLKDTQAFGVQIEEVEPGNRPLILHSTLAYATLATQSVSAFYAHGNAYLGADLIEESMKRSMKNASTNSELYWGYQTNDGKYFWAEGQYYFKLTFKSVLPFWHSLRTNQITSTSFTYYDPFKSTRITKPLEWLAQTYEPGGFSAPIDDGNKSLITSSSILRWDGNYGDISVGKRFSNIAEEISPSTKGVGLDANMRVFELSIPRTLTNLKPNNSWGNTSSSTPTNSSKQEIVFRYEDNLSQDHFIYLNGETQNSIHRGEGHENADQLQLLYSIGERSYLMDSGYDEVKSGEDIWDFLKGDDFNR